ncbi:hypothetical protein Bca52824_032896 [Brassica carinata]|uniref:Uncharacterized protein n=1 Tax=Brassica carinata TaxID=52824 RepID=A0A8X7V5K1_BRACI|nr:hypothetical protein Bca52824_032896 [Brassica carinata]
MKKPCRLSDRSERFIRNFLADGCRNRVKDGGVSSLIVFISTTKKMNTLVSTHQNLTVTVG